MTRIDKYEPNVGGFRAPIGFNTTADQLAVALGVGLDVNGRAVTGAGNTGVKGVLVVTNAKNAGDIVDIMTDGEMVEFPGVPGTNYYADGAGALTTAATRLEGTVTVNNTYVGNTVEATRLVVRSAR